MLVVESGDPREAQVRALLQASHALMHALYPPEERFALSIDDLSGPDIHFFVAREADQLMGTGALVACDGYGEVKSMFTHRDARGKGVAAALLRQIEDQARTLGLDMLKLETGEELAAAVRLYERQGFSRCGHFGNYPDCKSSVFMRKQLA